MIDNRSLIRNKEREVPTWEHVKSLLPDWKGADGCIATNRITVEGRKVGYCYREEPDGGWDSGWRFTAGDESDEYMDDPNNAGIYKLNTICNDDPDIIPLLNTPAPCAFERDENGVFQQIKDWKPDEDEEDPDMDILKQCQKWHEEDKHQKIVDALEAISAEERTPEMDMELARAYNNLADSSEPEGRKLLHQALELMQSHEEELGDTYSWNFRMGYEKQDYWCLSELCLRPSLQCCPAGHAPCRCGLWRTNPLSYLQYQRCG